MVDELRTDEEQGEALKKWLRENGWNLITGIGLGLAVLFGGKAWLAYQQRQAVEASNTYTQMLGALERDEPQALKAAADQLQSKHAGSPYAVFAAFALARQQVERGELDAAEAQLRWAVKHADWPEFAAIARLRLAQVVLAQERYDDAKAVLDKIADPAFAAQAQEIRGDIARRRGDQVAAHAAYVAALEALPEQAQAGYRHLLELKRDDSTPNTDDDGQSAGGA